MSFSQFKSSSDSESMADKQLTEACDDLALEAYAEREYVREKFSEEFGELERENDSLRYELCIKDDKICRQNEENSRLKSIVKAYDHVSEWW